MIGLLDLSQTLRTDETMDYSITSPLLLLCCSSYPLSEKSFLLWVHILENSGQVCGELVAYFKLRLIVFIGFNLACVAFKSQNANDSFTAVILETALY